MILQIGDMNSGIDPELFRECVADYKKAFELWNKEHGRHGHLITLALHYDEASPHAHIRRVWDYTDKDGNIRLGQNKALEAAGVELPDPEKKADRYNNRKMTFDAMMREKWIEICKSHGIEVETEPRVNMRHKDKAEYVAERLQQDIDAKTQRVKYVEADLVSALEQLEALEGKILEKEQITSLKVKKSVFGANKASIEGTEEELLGLYATAARVEEAEKAAKDAQSILDEKDRILEDAQRKAEEIMESANSFDAIARMARLESKVKKYEKVFAQYPELRQVMEKIAEKEH